MQLTPALMEINNAVNVEPRIILDMVFCVFISVLNADVSTFNAIRTFAMG
jgi:hypothetical protein